MVVVWLFAVAVVSGFFGFWGFFLGTHDSFSLGRQRRKTAKGHPSKCFKVW